MDLFSRKELIMSCHLGTCVLITVTLRLDDAHGQYSYMEAAWRLLPVIQQRQFSCWSLNLEIGGFKLLPPSFSFSFFFLFFLPAHSLIYPGFRCSNYTCQGKSARLPWSTSLSSREWTLPSQARQALTVSSLSETARLKRSHHNGLRSVGQGPTCAVLVGRKPLPCYTQQNEN